MNAATAVSTATRVGMILDPLDVLFFRDGRPFQQGARGTTRFGALPQTVAGAVWTALLESHACPFHELARLVRNEDISFADALERLGLPSWIAHVAVAGPWFARRSSNSPRGTAEFDLLFPVPGNVLRCSGRDEEQPVVVQRPLPEAAALPGWDSTRAGRAGLRPLWHQAAGKTTRAIGFLTSQGMTDYLAGRDIAPQEIIPAGQLYALDERTGIGIDPDTNSAEEHAIYSASFLSLAHGPSAPWETVIYVEVVLPDGAPEDAWPASISSLALGGEGRRVAVARRDTPFDFRALEPTDDDGPACYVLTTPGLFAGRFPQVIADQVVAAAVPPALPVSGWDMARGGPKPSRFAAPAGSVYFTRQSITPRPASLADDPFDRQQGWGAYLKGVWTDER